MSNAQQTARDIAEAIAWGTISSRGDLAGAIEKALEEGRQKSAEAFSLDVISLENERESINRDRERLRSQVEEMKALVTPRGQRLAEIGEAFEAGVKEVIGRFAEATRKRVMSVEPLSGLAEEPADDIDPDKRAAYIAAAREHYEDAGELEIDDDAVVSISEDQEGEQGAYVQVWAYVDKCWLD